MAIPSLNGDGGVGPDEEYALCSSVRMLLIQAEEVALFHLAEGDSIQKRISLLFLRECGVSDVGKSFLEFDERRMLYYHGLIVSRV